MFTDPEATKKFILAGKAIITLESEKTGNHFTYRVKKDEQKNLHWVYLLTGPNNCSDYSYLGRLVSGRFTTTKKSVTQIDAPSAAGFKYMCEWLGSGKMPPHMRIRHEGKCGKCGKKLTVPESIETGFGPECREMLGL